MDNNSTRVTICESGAASCDGGTYENELWDYTKNNFGLDAYWRLNRANRFGAGYDWYNIKQDRIDFDNNTTNTFWLEWKNTSLDTVQARLKYWYLKRTGDYLEANAGANANDPAYLNRFIRAFDLADLTQNKFKLTVDWAPRDNIGVAFEGIYKDNNYDETTLGRTGDTRYELFANLTWGTPSSWRMTLFGDYEHVKYDSYHRYFSSPTCVVPNCNDPANPPAASAYNWSSIVKNDNWLIGVGVDYPVNEKLALAASALYENIDGTADMQAQNNLATPAIIPFNNYPNSTTTSFQLKGSYKLDKNWSFQAGYAYQKYDFKDNQFTGYTNTVPWPAVATSLTTSYLNGWQANPNYTANIFWLTAKFAFDAAPLPPAPAPKMAEAPKPVVAPPPPPPPAPAPAPAPAPQVQKITLDSKVLFDFDKAVLKPEGKAAIDSQVVGKLAEIQKLEVVVVTGHTDRIGTDEYNQKLSQKRADAVRDYLVSKGVDKAKVETIGMGEKQPVVQCDQKNRKELIACLQPNRRVEVQAKGEAKK
jgi:outer membrane protein OmpA-like peptidoglycan-associated protein